MNTNSNASANTISISVTGTPTPGDLLVAIIHVNGNGTVTDNNGSTPFTQKATNSYNTNSAKAEIWTRRATASEPASFSFNYSLTDRISIILLSFSNVHPFDPFDVNPVFNNSSGTTVSATSITTLTDNAMVVACGFIDTSSVTVNTYPSGYSDGYSLGNQMQAIAFLDKKAKGSTGTASFSIGTGNGWGSYHFALRNNYLMCHKIYVPYTKVEGGANLSNYPDYLGDGQFLTEAFRHSQGKEIYTNLLLSDTNLKAYYRLEDVNDTTANAYNLTNVNTATFGTGMFNNAVDVNGSNQYLYTSNTALNFTGNFSYVARFKLDSYPTGTNQGKVVFERIASNAVEGMGIYVGDANSEGNRIYGLTWASTGGTLKLDSGIKPVLGEWYTVAFVKAAANNWKLYVNGLLLASSTSSRTISTTSKAGICIGAADQGSSGVLNYFDGKIDDVAIFDRALTAAEIKYLHTGGHDLRFTSDSAGLTKLAFEIVNWDIVNSKAEIYTKIPTLSYTTNTEFYVWYNDTLATPIAKDDTYGSNNAWDSDFVGVYHKTLVVYDSTSNANNPDSNLADYTSTGKISDAYDFEASNSDRINIPDSNSLDISTAITLEAWIKPETVGDAGIIAKCNSTLSSYNYLLSLQSGDELQFNWLGTGVVDRSFATTDNAIGTTGIWYYAAATKTFGVDDGALYVNGVSRTISKNGTQTTAVVTDTNPLTLGSWYTNGHYYDGLMDEVRISKVKRTAGWLATTYSNINDPNTFSIPVSLSEVKKVAGVTRANTKKINGVLTGDIRKIRNILN